MNVRLTMRDLYTPMLIIGKRQSSLYPWKRFRRSPNMIYRTHAAALGKFNTATKYGERKYYSPAPRILKAEFSSHVERGDSENGTWCFGSSDFRNSFPRRQMKTAAMIATAPMASEM